MNRVTKLHEDDNSITGQLQLSVWEGLEFIWEAHTFTHDIEGEGNAGIWGDCAVRCA